MSKLGVLGDALGQVGSLGKQAVKQVVKTPADLAKKAASQVGVTPESTGEQNQKVQEQMQKQAGGAAADQKATQDVVKGLYEKSASAPVQKTQASEKKVDPKRADERAQEMKDKTPEEIQEIEKLRQKLHQTTYYQPLIHRPKKQEEVERPQERVERQKMEDLQEKQKKDEKKNKKVPLAVQQGQNIEKFRGVSG